MSKAEARIKISAQDMASSKLKSLKGAVIGLVAAWVSFRGLRALGGFIGDITNAAMLQEKAVAKLNQQLGNWGELTVENTNRLTGLATELSRVTQFSDDQIVAGQAMLGSFALTSEQLAKATSRMLDIAIMTESTTGTMSDLTAVAKMMGMAMNRNAGMLSRAGIVFSDFQRAQLDASSGMEKFNLLMEIMDQNAGGLAIAIGKTWAGQMAIAKNQVGELKESLGDAIIKNEAWLAIIQFVTTKLIEFNVWIQENQSTIKEWATKSAEYFINFADFAATSLMDVGTAIAATVKALAQMISFFSRLSESLGIALQLDKDIIQMADDLQESADEIGTGFQSAKLRIEGLSVELRAFVSEAVASATPAIQGLTSAVGGAEAGGAGGGKGTGLAGAFEAVRVSISKTFIPLSELVTGIQDVSLNTDDINVKWLEFQEMMRHVAFDFTASWANNVIDSIWEGNVAFGEFVKNFLSGMAKMALKMVAFKLLRMAFGMPFGGGGVVPALHAQHGLIIPGGAPFTDRVPVMATPGERILSRGEYGQLGGERGLQQAFHNRFNMEFNITGGGDEIVQKILASLRMELPGMVEDMERRRQQ